MKLSRLPIGSTATILSVGGSGALRQHFLDMGLIQGTEVTVVKYAPMGDPIELRIHGYELTIRLEDAENIEISEPHQPVDVQKKSQKTEKHHPGYGEGGKFHNRKEENPLPEGETLTFALVGNQNCGKTTLFNQLTGSRQHVGNFPGVTVDRKDGVIRGYDNTLITDLPGIYSMSPYSSEEIVTREFVIQTRPKGIINIVDATNIERNLYLTMQLLELGIPMVVALNMMDELWENGGSVLVNEMEEALGVPVIPISAAKGEGIEELVRHAVHVARYQEKPLEMDFCKKEEGIHRGIHAVMHLIEDHAAQAQIPVRFAASKVMEGDEKILERLKLTDNEKRILDEIARQTEEETGMDRAAAVAQMRFDYIGEVCSETVIKPPDRPVPDGKIYGDPGLYRDHGAGILADLQCGRRVFTGNPGDGDRRADRHGRHGYDSRRRQQRGPVPGHRRDLWRRGRRSELPSHYRNTVFLPVAAGGQRLYGQSRLYHG